jgi:hypothetical protein
MKKLLITLVLTLAITAANAQSFVSEIRHELGTKPEVNINIGTWLVKLMMKFADEDDPEAKALMDGLKRIKVTVFDLDNSHNSNRLNTIIENKIQHLSSKGYEQLVSVRDHGDNVFILAKVKGNLMQDAMIIAYEKGDELAIINLKGDVNLKQLAAISEEYDVDIEDAIDI